jgi:sulfate transporter 4
LQIAIANPNQQVHLLLSRSGILDLIGAAWCFVRVHDAVQVCLQHVQNASSSALKLASQASGDSADSISTSKEGQQRIKQDGFFKWKAKNGNADSGAEVQPLLRQNLV